MFRKVIRKDLQLCAQVQEALYWVLGTAVGDETLANLQVESVEPMPDASRFLVTASAPADLDLEEVFLRLRQATKAIRAEVANSINRRKAPDLAFRVTRR